MARRIRDRGPCGRSWIATPCVPIAAPPPRIVRKPCHQTPAGVGDRLGRAEVVFQEIDRLVRPCAASNVFGYNACTPCDVVLPVRNTAQCHFFDEPADVDRLLSRACVACDLFPA